MPRAVQRLAVAGLLAAIVMTPGSIAGGQEPPAWASQDLTAWVRQFPIPGSRLQEAVVARVFGSSESIRPFTGQAVVGLGISGDVQFSGEGGLVRIVVVDDQFHEYLVYESYPLIAASQSLQIRNACRETCVLPPTVFSHLNVELVDASLDIRTIVSNQLMTRTGPVASASETTQRMQEVKAAQEAEIIDTLNRRIEANGLKWIAGETPISQLSYSEKRALISCLDLHPDTPPNLQGAEYYKGGIFVISPRETSTLAVTPSSVLTDSFDWRSRHGANTPGSPYYDHEVSGGGWMTSIKSQRCADCWAHSALGATEALVNLYFNRHLDLDLSEQELVSCSGAGSCRFGGNTGAALSYVQTVGVVDEACFPESGVDESCGNCCRSPRDRIAVTGFDAISPAMGEDNIKWRLIQSGPLPFGISSWWHAMVLTGYMRDTGTGETVWILKNSWGAGWGENGYAYVKVPLNDIYLTYNLHGPVLSGVTPYAVACRDADEDGYFNWGISSGAPPDCGNVPPLKDCDDSDPAVAFLTERGDCTAPIPIDTTPPSITVTVRPSRLWPPDKRLVRVLVTGTITDGESGVAPDEAQYTVADEYGRAGMTGPVFMDASGRYTFAVRLEAARRGNDRDGRHYEVTVAARDRAGNSASVGGMAVVPHDRRR
jgi:hypothetical protein